MTAWIVVTVVSKSSTSWLIATFITAWSRTIRNCAAESTTSTAHLVIAPAYAQDRRCGRRTHGRDRDRPGFRVAPVLAAAGGADLGCRGRQPEPRGGQRRPAGHRQGLRREPD